MYKGQADWNLIREIKRNPRIQIPIFGNGDVDSVEKAANWRLEYEVDGIMIGRAAIGYPWIFREIKHFFATGVSIVLHPKHPRHPIIHMNVRYFELDNGASYWFGGGIDLTPHYVDRTLAADFHQQLKETSDQFSSEFYPKFKEWADRYFYLPHREESRGIGGIFFDHLDETCGLTKNEIFQYCMALGHLFPKAYKHQVDSITSNEASEQELNWQALRRGRYVEFNLLHDRGTKFGIYSGGRTESILMSMPPRANWEYNLELEEESEEAETLAFLRKTHEFSLK
jgi:coproporphyrinogen III oxidase